MKNPRIISGEYPMRNRSLVCALLGALSWAQGKPASPAPPPANSAAAARDGDDQRQSMPPSAAAVGPNDAVLTIKGLCSPPATGSTADSADASCRTVITRAEFEKLTGAIQPGMTPATKRQFASKYPGLLMMSQVAEQRGLDKQEHFQELITYSRLQLLSQELARNIQEQAARVPDKDIEDYYREHLTSFERATLERIFVPTKWIKKQTKEAMAKEAELLRERAVAGEDFGKLQRAAYDAAGVTSPIPSYKLANWRPGSLPESHRSVFSLKVGEISPVIGDSTAYYIYKLDAKEMEPLEEARAEIQTILQTQRAKYLMKQLQESISTEANQAYFGSPTPPKSPDPASVKPDDDDD
jgi:hypothetical protein